MLNMADVMAESGFTEEDVFDCGISGQIIFLVVVPLIGACRVPVEALSHFMAGADDYAAEEMPEHWSGALSGKWTIKRDRLRILPQSWEAFSDNSYKLAESLDAASEPNEAGAGASPSGDDIPGKMPRTAIGKLAITAAWEIEGKTGKRASANQVIAKLVEWIKTEPILLEKIPHGIRWMTTNATEADFCIEACGTALAKWNLTRP
jgi:hypothetical protein